MKRILGIFSKLSILLGLLFWSFGDVLPASLGNNLLIQKENVSLKRVIESQFSGYGFLLDVLWEFGEKENTHSPTLRVYYTFPDSPAALAGLEVGDTFLQVNGIFIQSFPSILELLLYFESKNHLELTVLRPNTQGRLAIQKVVLDGKWHKESVWGVLDLDKAWYVHIGAFTDSLKEEFLTFYRTLPFERQNKGLIFDLRGTPGGSFRGVLSFLDLFFSNEEVLYITPYAENTQYVMKTDTALEILGVPIAVLVDQTVASAAEIFAGVLQQKKRAVLLGSNTYGKATFQKSLLERSSQRIFLVTLGEYTLTNGVSFAGVGLSPNVCTPFEWEDFSSNREYLKQKLGEIPWSSYLHLAPIFQDNTFEWILNSSKALTSSSFFTVFVRKLLTPLAVQQVAILGLLDKDLWTLEDVVLMKALSLMAIPETYEALLYNNTTPCR